MPLPPPRANSTLPPPVPTQQGPAHSSIPSASIERVWLPAALTGCYRKQHKNPEAHAQCAQSQGGTERDPCDGRERTMTPEHSIGGGPRGRGPGSTALRNWRRRELPGGVEVWEEERLAKHGACLPRLLPKAVSRRAGEEAKRDKDGGGGVGRCVEGHGRQRVSGTPAPPGT